MRDLLNELALVQLLEPQTLTSTADSTSNLLDCAQFDAAVIAVNLGTWTGVDSDSKCEFVLQESDSVVGTSFEDVDDADIIGEFTLVDATTEDQVIQSVGYIGSKRYVRVKIDMTAGTGGITAALVSVTGLLGYPDEKPMTAPAAVSAT